MTDSEIDGVKYKNLGERRFAVQWEKYPWWHFRRWWYGQHFNFSKPIAWENMFTFRLWREGKKGLCEGYHDILSKHFWGMPTEALRKELRFTAECVNEEYDFGKNPHEKTVS